MHNRSHRRVVAALLIAAGLSLGACGRMYVKVDEPRPSAPPAADTARVYFLLPQGFPAGYAWVLRGEDLVGYVQNRQYFLREVPAGEHLFMLVSENTEGLKGRFEGGKSYYVRLFVAPGIMSTRVYWVMLEAGKENWDSRQAWLNGSTRVALNPAKADAWEKKYAAKNAARLARYTSGQAEPKTFGPEAGE